MLKYFQKTKSLSVVFSEKIGYTLISSVLFHFGYTHDWIVVALVYLLTFWNSILGKLKKILLKNAFPQKYIDECIQKFLNNTFFPTPHIAATLKKELTIILRYLGKMSQIVKTRLPKTTSKVISKLEKWTILNFKALSFSLSN